MDKANQNEPSTVEGILRQIEEKADAGEYIYRGESKHFETVSSNLYRVFLIHGFITYQNIHLETYVDFYIGLTEAQKGDSENGEPEEISTL